MCVLVFIKEGEGKDNILEAWGNLGSGSFAHFFISRRYKVYTFMLILIDLACMMLLCAFLYPRYGVLEYGML